MLSYFLQMVGSTGVGKVQSCVNYLFHTNASGIKVESSKQTEFVGRDLQ